MVSSSEHTPSLELTIFSNSAMDLPTMLFNPYKSSFSEVMKWRSDFTVVQLGLELELRPSKRLAKDYYFMTAMAASERTRKFSLMSVEKGIKVWMKYVDPACNIILSLAKCSIYDGTKRKRKRAKRWSNHTFVFLFY